MGKSRKKRGFPRFFQKIHACFRFLRNALWYTMKYSTALTGMATNTSRIECCLTSTVDAQISSPSGSATHCKCRLQSGSESKQASVSAAPSR